MGPCAFWQRVLGTAFKCENCRFISTLALKTRPQYPNRVHVRRFPY